MELSLLLAKIIGLSLIFIASSLLLNKKNIDLLFKVYDNPGAIYLTGFLEIFLAILLIVKHNIWVWDFRVIITFIGWMLLVRGFGRLFSPRKTTEMIRKFKKYRGMFPVLLIFIIILGAYLSYMGFTK